MIEQYKGELNKVKRQFKKSTNFNVGDLTRSSITVGVPTSLTAFGTIYSLSQQNILSNFFSSVSIGFVAAIADYSKVKKDNRGPSLGSYLLNLERAYPNYNGLNSLLEQRMDEFIND